MAPIAPTALMRLNSLFRGKRAASPSLPKRPPEQDRQELDVADERVLAWSPLPSNGCVIATRSRLLIRTPRGQVIRRSWSDVERLAWDQDSRTVAVWWLGSGVVMPLEVAEGSFFPEVAHERVRASIVASREVVVPGYESQRVTVVLRQGDDGSLIDQVHGLLADAMRDPAIADAIHKSVRDLRDAVNTGSTDTGQLPKL
jgi:hypothetical protein